MLITIRVFCLECGIGSQVSTLSSSVCAIFSHTLPSVRRIIDIVRRWLVARSMAVTFTTTVDWLTATFVIIGRVSQKLSCACTLHAHTLPGFRPLRCFSKTHSLPCRVHLLQGTLPSVGAEHRICESKEGRSVMRCSEMNVPSLSAPLLFCSRGN
jgi:hypothetical protein